MARRVKRGEDPTPAPLAPDASGLDAPEPPLGLRGQARVTPPPAEDPPTPLAADSAVGEPTLTLESPAVEATETVPALGPPDVTPPDPDDWLGAVDPHSAPDLTLRRVVPVRRDWKSSFRQDTPSRFTSLWSATDPPVEPPPDSESDPDADPTAELHSDPAVERRPLLPASLPPEDAAPTSVPSGPAEEPGPPGDPEDPGFDPPSDPLSGLRPPPGGPRPSPPLLPPVPGKEAPDEAAEPGAALPPTTEPRATSPGATSRERRGGALDALDHPTLSPPTDPVLPSRGNAADEPANPVAPAGGPLSEAPHGGEPGRVSAGPDAEEGGAEPVGHARVGAPAPVGARSAAGPGASNPDSPARDRETAPASGPADRATLPSPPPMAAARSADRWAERPPLLLAVVAGIVVLGLGVAIGAAVHALMSSRQAQPDLPPVEPYHPPAGAPSPAPAAPTVAPEPTPAEPPPTEAEAAAPVEAAPTPASTATGAKRPKAPPTETLDEVAEPAEADPWGATEVSPTGDEATEKKRGGKRKPKDEAAP